MRKKKSNCRLLEEGKRGLARSLDLREEKIERGPGGRLLRSRPPPEGQSLHLPGVQLERKKEIFQEARDPGKTLTGSEEDNIYSRRGFSSVSPGGLSPGGAASRWGGCVLGETGGLNYEEKIPSTDKEGGN